MAGAWWACHWCDYETPIRRRLFDRLRGTREFNRHLRQRHPDMDYRATLGGAVSGQTAQMPRVTRWVVGAG